MAVENKNESTAKKLEIEMLRKMGIDVVLDKDEFSSVLKANETLQKMELELNKLTKLNNELNSLKDEKKSIDNSNQKLKEKTVERGKNNFAEFIEAAKAMKNFIPENNELRSYFTYWEDVNKITLSLNNELKEDDKSRYFITIAKDPENNIVCIRENNASDAVIYFSEKDNIVNENEKVWFLYNIFSSSNRIDELKIAIKENLEKRIGKTKEQLSEAHKNLLEAEKAAQKANLLSENKTNSYENLSIDNSTSISNDEFLELSRSIDYKSFELLANKIQAGSAEYWTNMACVQIEEYNTNQLKWILDNREVRFDGVERNYSLNKQQDEIKKTLNLPQWAAVSDDPETIDIVFSKMTEKDFKWAKENGIFKIAEDFYKDKNENFSFPFETLKDWVKKYDTDYSNDKIVRHFYARQVPPEDQYYDINSELANLDISIIESYSGSKYTEIINNDIPNGSMKKFADTMNEISDDYENFFKDGVNPTEEDINNGKAVYKSFEEALNTELPKKDGAKYTEEEIKEWRNIFEQYGNAGDMGSYWSSTNATHAVLTQVMKLQTGESFVSVSLKGSSQGEDVTAVIPEHIYTEEFKENLEAKYWNEGVEYLVFEDKTGMHHNLEELQEHDIFENNSVSYYLPSYKSVEKLASVLGARKRELTVYDFEGYEKSPKYEKVQYMKTLSNPLDDLRTVLKAYEHGFDNDYKLDEYDENRVTKGKWSIATGGYDLAWEVYYENIPVASCDTDNILIGNNNNSFTGFTEADMLRVITQEYKNVKCPEIEIPTVEDYEQYLNDYFHDGSFTLEPENAFDEYPFEKLLNENLERHYHYERDSAGGVILSYDYSNHTEYLQPGDDANTFLEEVEKIENGVIQINTEEQLDNLINNYFPDFFPDNFRDEDTKTFITQQDIIEAVDNFECGKLYKEYNPEGFAKDAHEWIEEHTPAFTEFSEMPQYMKTIPFAKCELKKIEKWQIEEAKECGLNLEGYKHEITTDFIAHVVKNHSNVITEAQRGNIAVTEKDLASLNDVISSPDRVVYGVTNKVFVAGQIIERPSIIYAKNMSDGTSLYFEEVLDGNKNNSMRGKTFWKKANSISDKALLNIIGSNKSVTNIENAKIKVHENGDQIHHLSSTETVDAEVNSAAREPNETIAQFVKKSIADYTAAKSNAEGQIANGQVLGFVKDNKIYINIDFFNSETPIHEYTHLWDKAIQKTNPELWKQGVELLKMTNTWKEIERNPAYADIAGDEDLLASEVHARLVGKNGAEIFNNIVTENPSITSEEIQKSAQKWDEKAWKHVRENFTNWKTGDLQTSVKDFVNITLNDFLNGKNPVQNIENNISQENIQMQYERKTHNEYTIMSNYGYGWEEEAGYDNLQEARKDLKAYRENGGGSYHLKHHTRVPNGFTVEDGHYVPEEDITPENFKTYFKAALKLRQISGNPQKAAAYCFKHANMPSKLQGWLEKQGCTTKENSDKLFEKWAKEERKPEQSKVKTKSKENDNWSISD